MHLSKVNEALEHKIVNGTEFQWNCYDNARYLDYESEHAYASVLFDPSTQEVYIAEVNDKENKHKPYRYMNPLYKDLYINEANQRNVDYKNAWDDVEYYDLEVENDWLEKAHAIMFGLDFDPRVQIEVDLDKDELLTLYSLAHERDITFNQLVEQIIMEVIKKHNE